MLNDRKYSIISCFEIADQLYRSININQVIIRQFFTVYLVKDFVQVAIEACRLMRILTVTQALLMFQRL
ncbi:hypothetical protein D3C80_1523810 [compost metagenome]